MRKMSDIGREYDYRVPPGLVAMAPAKPRDAARLLVCDRATGRTTMDTFRNIVRHLPPRSIIVLNDTRVIPARLWAHKETGGRVQVFYLGHDGRSIRALSDAGLRPGMRLAVADGLTLTVIGKRGGAYTLRASWPVARMAAVLEKYGTTPIPPYLRKTALSEQRLRREYQTLWARVRGSVAAPTASLHFTDRLLRGLRKAGHDIRFITLHVGLGTFAPLTAAQVRSGRLHAERYTVPPDTARALRSGRPVVAVGTTVARTLESWAATGRRQGQTRLFIRPGYRWHAVDALITNFHVPCSSLMMLAASFAGSRALLLRLYRRAVHARMRFFSFGDAMLLR